MGDIPPVLWTPPDHNGIATLTLNRPARRNALSPALIERLRVHLADAKADCAVRVVVLTGAGDRVFCAGGDLTGGMTGDVAAGFLATVDDKAAFIHVMNELNQLGKPVVARVNGHVLAGGVGLMLACDLVVAADDVELGLPEVRVGLWPMMVTALLTRHVGRKVAAELLMLGERIDMAEARRLGLVNRVVPRARLDDAVGHMVENLAARSPAVMRLGKDALYQTEDQPLDAALWSLRDRLVVNTLLEDAAEGVTAFFEKRAPVWKGR